MYLMNTDTAIITKYNYYFLYIIIMWPSGPINYELEHKIAVVVANVVADKIKGWMHKK